MFCYKSIEKMYLILEPEYAIVIKEHIVIIVEFYPRYYLWLFYSQLCVYNKSRNIITLPLLT
jgi:CDP-glycerol glycerophosphotransferase (TagB/SpsB family)